MREPTVDKLLKIATIDLNAYIRSGSRRAEENVKLKIIIPILELLGYDLIKDMDFERNVRNKFIDIAISIDGKIELLIEVKDLNENLDKHIEQALNYAFNAGVNYVILTNGYEIRLYKSYVPYSDLKDRLIYKLYLANIDKGFKYIWNIISKDKLFKTRPTLDKVRELRDDFYQGIIYLNGILDNLSEKPDKNELLNNALRYQKSYKYQKAILEYRKCMILDDVSETEKIVILNFIGKCFFDQCKISEALGCFYEAFDLANQLDLSEAICEFYVNLSAIQIFTGELNLSLDSVIKAQHISAKTKNRHDEAIVKEHLGRIYRRQGLLDKALLCFEDTLRINKEIGNRQGEAASLNSIGKLNSIRGQLDEALKCMEQALKINLEIGNRKGEAVNLDFIGRLKSIQGKIDEALNYMEKALKINQEIGNRQGEAVNFGGIGRLKRNQGKLDEALNYMEQALKIHQEIGNPSGEAFDLESIGRLKRDQGIKSDEALKFFEKALQINQALGYRHGVASNLDAIGRVMLSQQNFSKALSCFEDALKIHQEIGFPSGEAASISIIARVKQNEGNLDEALEYFEHSLKIAQKIQHRRTESINLDAIGRIKMMQDKLDEALIYFNDALKINKIIGYRHGEAVNLYDIGIIYESKKDFKRALQNLRESRKIFNEIGVFYKIRRVAKKIRKISRNQEN